MDVVAAPEISYVWHEILIRRKRLIALGASFLRLTAWINIQTFRSRQLDLLTQMSDNLIHQQNNRCAKPLGIVHSHNRGIIGLTDAPRRQGNNRVITVCSPACLHHIGLRRCSRLSGGRADTLDIDQQIGRAHV